MCQKKKGCGAIYSCFESKGKNNNTKWMYL